MTMLLRHIIHCNKSGLPIGTLEVATTAGALPYLSYWDKCVGYHPVFSMQTVKLLKFTQSEWTRLAQRAEDSEISDDESNILRVSFLAVLHTLDCVRQDEPALPPLHIVTTSIQRLFKLAYWKWRLESQRFAFPTLHLSKPNKNLDFSNLPDYLDLCFEIKAGYETKVREIEEQEKIRVAEEALIALNNTWITPTSKRMMWRWIEANLSEKHRKEDAEWMSAIFLGSPLVIQAQLDENLEWMEEIIMGDCPVGTGVMHAVRKRIDEVWQIWKNHNSVFEIDLEDFADPATKLLINGVKQAAVHPGDRPTLASCDGNKAKFFVADAKWQIAMATWNKENPQ